MRSFLSVFAGLTTGIVVISLLEAAIPQLNVQLFGEGLEEAGETITRLNLIFVLFAWSCGAFIAALVCSTISNNMIHSTITSILLMIAAGIQFIIVPQPWWFILLALSLFIPLARLAHLIVNNYQKNKL